MGLMFFFSQVARLASSVEIPCVEIAWLAKALAHWSSFVVKGETIGQLGLLRLATVFKCNTSITSISMEAVGIDDCGAAHLARV